MILYNNYLINQNKENSTAIHYHAIFDEAHELSIPYTECPPLFRYQEKVDKNPKLLSTFLCENCCEAVQVTTALLGNELRFKCPVCHQENHYDLS